MFGRSVRSLSFGNLLNAEFSVPLGVVLWEFFSLGKVPYTGMEANQNLYYKLRDGYRMEKPPLANQDLYDIMLHCWNAKPESRPLFKKLEQQLGSFLHESVKDVSFCQTVLWDFFFNRFAILALHRS